MHSLYLRKMTRSNSKSIYVEDKCCVKYQKRVDIYGTSDYQIRCMYAECCGYILISASALCLHVGMSAFFARPFVHQSVASARLSVRLMIVYHCSRTVVLSSVRPFV